MSLPFLRLGTRPEDFIWASGIEDTFVPQTKPGHRALDEYELIGHYEHWREDLALSHQLGVRMLRWGVPWYRVEPSRGHFDWSWTDQVLPYLVEELGITPMIDLMHYGCPHWLDRAFANPAYPEAVATYAAAFAQRYKHLVRWYTPLNEPLINSMMCGRYGRWPPYLRGDSGYVRVMLQLTRGIVNTVNAIKVVDDQAIMVHVEACGLSRSERPDLQPLVEHNQHVNWLCFDLLTAKVTPAHPLYLWLLRSGANPDDLAALAAHPIALDVLGMNFYPQWSTKHIEVNAKGQIVYRIVEKEGIGFVEMVDAWYDRYRRPIIITETSARGSIRARSQWLKTSVAAVKYLRAHGVPVVGYTWFPMFTMIEWGYRTGRRPVNEYRIELGLFTLGKEPSDPRWLRTPLVEQFHGYTGKPEEAIGDLAIRDRQLLSFDRSTAMVT